jgi:hypothetical protein
MTLRRLSTGIRRRLHAAAVSHAVTAAARAADSAVAIYSWPQDEDRHTAHQRAYRAAYTVAYRTAAVRLIRHDNTPAVGDVADLAADLAVRRFTTGADTR